MKRGKKKNPPSKEEEKFKAPEEEPLFEFSDRGSSSSSPIYDLNQFQEATRLREPAYNFARAI